MTNSKQTKKALLSSVIALVLCLSMLIGTTFAWFTDTVSSDLNEIKAGNLDVELDYYSATEKDWLPVQGATDLFSDELWEPGHTEVVYLRLTNAGTLDLKWQLGISIAAEQGSISVVEGNPAFKLSDFIQFGVVDLKVDAENPFAVYAKREDAVAALNGESKKLNAGYSDSGAMTAGAVEYVAVVVYMPETVGNEANYMKGAPVPSIDLGVKLYATQKDAESDSFGDDYDKNASLTVTEDSHKDGTLTLAQAIAQVEDGGIVFVEPGTYTIGSVITITGKSLSIIGMGNVQLEYAQTGGSHFFNVTSDSNVSFENMTLVNAAKHGIYVRNDSVVTLTDVSVSGSRGSADIMVDEASDAAHGKNTASYVWMYNSSAERVALCASPVTTVAATQDTYVYFNYDAESTVGSIEKQSINKKPENIYINGVNVEGNGMNLYVTNDAELKAALETIQNNSKYHNVPVYVHLAAGEYSADHVINQYPEWNGIVGRNNGNNYQGGVPAGAPSTIITFVGETASTLALRGAQVVPAVTFTGNVTVNGFGDAQAGLDCAVARTTFENIAFANGTKTNANGDIAAVEMTAASANVTFTGCTFQNAEYVIVGARACNIVGDMTFDGCTFRDVCISGYVDKTITVKNSTVISADGGFVNNQNNGDIIVDNCTVNAGRYFVRTNGSGIEIEVTNSDITVYESEGTKHLVYFRGSNESAVFTDCVIADGWTTQGVDADSTLTIRSYFEIDGLLCYTDGVTGDVVLYNASAFNGSDLVIPDGITVLNAKVFNKMSNIESITLPKSLTDINNGAFMGTNIKSIIIPGSVSLNERADGKSHAHTFAECHSLASLTIGEGVTAIPSGCFVSCTNLTEAIIPASVDSLGKKAFYDCLSLKTVYLLSADCTIGAQAFGANQQGFQEMTIYVVNEEMKAAVEATLTDNNKNSVTVAVMDSAPTINGTTYVYNAEQMADAVAAGATNLYLADGEYDIRGCGGKTLTINGSKNAVIKVANEGENGHDAGCDGATVTFNGVTFNTTANGGQYRGFTRMNGIYNDCAFIGSYTTSSGVHKFYNCAFDLKNNYVWTWGASDVLFDNCTFEDANGVGKAILVHEGAAVTNVTVRDCTFTASTAAYTWDGLYVAAVSIDPVGASKKITVNFEGTNTVVTTEGATADANGNTGFAGLHQIKYANETAQIMVKIDGEAVENIVAVDYNPNL